MLGVHIVDYPVYSLASDGQTIVASGGGGGAEYGISDVIETYRKENNSLSVKLETSNPIGIFDGLIFSRALKRFFGNNGTDLVIFRCDQETFREDKRWSLGNDKKCIYAERIAVSRGGKYVACVSEKGLLQVFRLIHDEISFQKKISTDDRVEMIEPLKVAEWKKEGTARSDISYTDLKFSPCARWLALCSKADRLVHLVRLPSDLATRTEQAELQSTHFAVSILRLRGNIPTPRSLMFLGENTTGKMGLLVTGYGNNKAYISKVHLNLPHPNDKEVPQVLTDVNIFKQISIRNCKMLNCFTASNDKGLAAVSSNTDIYIFSVEPLKLLSKMKRGTGSDLPTTGLSFLEKEEYIVVGAADFSIQILPTRLMSKMPLYLILFILFFLLLPSAFFFIFRPRVGAS